MRVDPRHLRVALAIAEHGSFNKAAVALGVSQPALSKSISLLEYQIGAKLFDRDKRGTSLTEAGRILVLGARNIENMLARTRNAIHEQAEGAAGSLFLGSTPSMMLGLLPSALTRLSRSHPKISFKITEGLDSVLLPALRHGDIELLVGPLAPTQAYDPDITEIPLMQEHFFVAVPPDHRLARRRILKVEDLIDESWSLPTPGSSFFRIVEAMFLSAGLGLPLNAIATNSLALQERMIASGWLCFVTPSQLAGRKVAFKVLPLASAPARVWGARHMTGIVPSPLAAAFIDVLRDTAQDLAAANQAIASTDAQ